MKYAEPVKFLTQDEILRNPRPYSVDSMVREFQTFRSMFPRVIAHIDHKKHFPRHVYISGIDLRVVDRELGQSQGLFGSHEKVFLLDKFGDAVYREKISFRNRSRFIFCLRHGRVRQKVVKVVRGDFSWPFDLRHKLWQLEERAATVYSMLSYWSVTGALIYYLPPAGINLPDWIHQLRCQSVHQFAKEVAAFDAQAVL